MPPKRTSGGARGGRAPRAIRASRSGGARTPRSTGVVLGRTEFDSGLRIVTERMPSVRSVTLGVWVAAGSRDERPALAGASHFLEHLLFNGTPNRRARDIYETFEAVGGVLQAITSREDILLYDPSSDRAMPTP